jgi:hypothetical protein
MKSRSEGSMPFQVRDTRLRFENWRRTKHPRDPIPERLWMAAVRLCQRHAIFRVAKWLRLNYIDLRNRARAQVRAQAKIAAGPSARSPRPRQPTAPTFVEWTMPASLSGAEYVLEVEGTDVKVRVRGAAVTDVAALAKLLGSEQP